MRELLTLWQRQKLVELRDKHGLSHKSLGKRFSITPKQAKEQLYQCRKYPHRLEFSTYKAPVMWTDEEKTTLHHLRKCGLSLQWCGTFLGRTRSAVAGQLYRSRHGKRRTTTE